MNICETPLSMLTKEAWEQADRRLLAKMLQEFMYEEIIVPVKEQADGPMQEYEWIGKDGTIFRFSAKSRMFDSVTVVPESISIETSEEQPSGVPHSILLLKSVRLEGGMDGSTAGHLVKEYLHTLMADVHLSYSSKTSSELVEMDYAELEGEMTGHPWITYNKGRIGFSYDDYIQFAPEQKRPVRLSWIAVHNSIGTFHCSNDISWDMLIDQELGENTAGLFRERLESMQLNPEEYFFMPVHEWQWNKMIVTLYAAEITAKRIVPLGEGTDRYLPQQSIRTFVNISNKAKFHVKLPMSILNTLVYRGLPGERTAIAPAVTAFIKNIRDQDPFLKEECRLGLLGEVASMNVDHPVYSHLEGAPYQYLEMLGVVWRESVYREVHTGEKPITLAALLHIDHEGRSFVSELISRSGLSPEAWTKKLAKAVLPPLLHYLYQYGTVFSPHGQNTVLVLKDDAPERLIMKDFVDDVNISDQPLPELDGLEPALNEVLLREPPEGLAQFIFTGLFICHFRYLAVIMDDSQLLKENVFWSIMEQEIKRYEERFPHLQERFELFNLRRPAFTKLTLNRNRMFDYGYEDDSGRPHASTFGKVSNPLHRPEGSVPLS